MLNQLLPARVDNTYLGHKLALWVFVPLVLMKIGISLGSIFNGHDAASSADGIPLDTYTLASVQTVLSLFALLGLAQLTIGALCVLVFVRYRAMIPLMFLLLLLNQLGRKLVLYFLPIVRVGTPPGSLINLVLLGLMIAGFLLSLRPQNTLRSAPRG